MAIIEKIKLDEKDLDILYELQQNAKRSVFQLAKIINIPPTTIHNRIRKLKENGVIEAYVARINREKIGQIVCALVFVSLNNNELESSSKKGGLANQIAKYPNVDEVFETTGNVDIVVKVYGKDIRGITDFVINKIREFKGVTKTETVIALSEISKR